MKLLWYAKQYDTPMSKWVLVHIRDELRMHGIEIDYFDILKYRTPQEANDRFLEYFDLRIKEGNSYDFFITDYNEHDIFIDTLQEIKRRGLPTVLMCCDNLVVPYRHKKIAPFFDLVWLTSSDTEWMFKKKGCHTIFQPYAANPNLIHTDKKETVGVGFVGTPYGSRSNMINALISSQIDVYCYCKKDTHKNNGKYINTPVEYKSMYTESSFYVFRKMLGYKEGRKIIKGALVNKIKPESRLKNSSEFYHEEYMVEPENVYIPYGRHSLSLSSTTARNTGVLKEPLYIVNLRSFEIPMAGGIQFCRYNPELAGYFKEDKEIVFFKDNEEMIEKAKFYLAPEHTDIRKRMRVEARKRAEGEHTWFHRFKRIFEELGIPIKGIDIR